MQEKLDPITLMATAAVVGALAGLAALLRSSTALTVRNVVSALLNSSALGAGLAMLLFAYFQDNTWFLLGLCLLAGLGGMTILGFLLAMLRTGGVDVHVDVKPGNKGE